MAKEDGCVYRIIEDLFSRRELRRMSVDWPWQSCGGWLRYDSPGELKMAMRDGLPDALREGLTVLDSICPFKFKQDPTRHGAGAHMLPIGGFLDPHLDCDVHPKTGYRRAQNAILFLDDFLPAWGGDLFLYAPDLSGQAKRITPKAGRVVVFDCDDKSYHGVPGPICGPIPRRSLAVYWWEPMPAEWVPKRKRAQFVAMATDEPNAEKDLWRRQRCQ